MGQAMSEQDELDSDLGDNSEDEEDNAGSSGSANDAPPDGAATSDANEKRVNDLMGKWQSEQAKAAKLQQELDAERAKASLKIAKSKTASAGDKAAEEFVQFARESARKQLFDSDPRLTAYGLSPEAIVGDSIEDMKTSFKGQVELIAAIETRARNEVLSEHGLDPRVEAGGSAGELPSFLSMDDKDFEAFVAKRDDRLR